jgi:hypothetical protein
MSDHVPSYQTLSWNQRSMAYNSTQQQRIASGLGLICAQSLTPGNSTLFCPNCASNRSKRQAQRARFRRIQARCVTCGAPCEPRRLKCSSCLVRDRKYQDTLRQKRLDQGGCVQCGASSVLPSLAANAKYRLCEACYLKKLSRQRLGSNQHWTVLRDKLAAQNWRCAYSGAPLVLGINDSLDHVFPASRFPDLARDPGNVEWVSREINELKRDRTPDEFLSLLRSVLTHRPTS